MNWLLLAEALGIVLGLVMVASAITIGLMWLMGKSEKVATVVYAVFTVLALTGVAYVALLVSGASK